MKNSTRGVVLALGIALTALSPLATADADAEKVELKEDNYRAANFVVG